MGEGSCANKRASSQNRLRSGRLRAAFAALLLGFAGCASTGDGTGTGAGTGTGTGTGAGTGTGDGQKPRGVLRFGTGTGQDVESVSVAALGGFVAAGYLFSQDEDKSSGRETTEHYAEERVGLGIEGSVLSPEFLKYEGVGVVGLTQAWTKDTSLSDSESEYDAGDLYGADAAARFFSARSYPLTLTFTRNDSSEPRVFFSRYERTNTVARGLQQFLGERGRLNLEATYRRLKQTVAGIETGLPPDTDITEGALKVSGDYRITDRQTVTASYRYQDVEQDVEQDVDGNSFDAHNFLALHSWKPDTSQRHEIRSRFEAISQDGSLDQELLRLDEILRSELTEHLRADAAVQLERNETNVVDRDEISGHAGLTHMLFESLQSSARVMGGRVESDGENTTDSIGGTVDFDYKKLTPAGILRANYSNSLSRLWVENGSGGAIDEVQTFPTVPPEEVILEARAIEADTLVVTDPSGFIFYREGIDYTVFQDSLGFTTLTRVFAGAIPIGGTILVDYRNQLGTDYTIDTMTQVARLEHEFHGGLTPYFAFWRQDQSVSDVEGPDDIVGLDERSLIGGLEWRADRFLVGGEFEDRNSTLVPFQAVRLRGQGDLPLGERNSLSASADQVWFFYEEPDRDLSVSQGLLRWNSRLRREFDFDLTVAFRYQDDTRTGSSTAFSVSGGLEYVWRKTSFQIRGAYRDVDSNPSGYRGAEASVWIVRRFGGTTRASNHSLSRMTRR